MGLTEAIIALWQLTKLSDMKIALKTGSNTKNIGWRLLKPSKNGTERRLHEMKNKIGAIIISLVVIAILTAGCQTQRTDTSVTEDYMWKIYVTEGDNITEYIVADYINSFGSNGKGKVLLYDDNGEHIGTVGGGTATVRIERITLENGKE